MLTGTSLLVGAATADDAGVYRLDRHRALVQTIDFFTPIVDDPYRYGQIAAANALSDVYAMGGRPLTAMNVVGMPVETVPPPIIRRILEGGAATVKQAGCFLVGGHSIKNPEPLYGLSVTGLVNPTRLMTNAAARPGDVLVLTKPLGTGILTTGIKRNLVSAALARRAIASMSALNTGGAEVAERRWVRAGTDVTGFGLLGHLKSLCQASGVGAELDAARVPVLAPAVLDLIDRGCVPGGTRDNLAAAQPHAEWIDVPERLRILLADAQTSGGLLLCVPGHRVAAVCALFRARPPRCAAVIGRIVAAQTPRLRVTCLA